MISAKHIIPHQLKRGSVSTYIFNGYWEGIGTISAYFHANLALIDDHSWMQQYNEIDQFCTLHSNISTSLIKHGKITHSLIN